MKKLVRNVSLLLIAVFALITYFVLNAIEPQNHQWEEYSNESFSTIIPKVSYSEDAKFNQWSGLEAQSLKPLGLWSYQKNDKWDAERTLKHHLKSIKDLAFSQKLDIYDGGYFALRSAGKSFRRYIYLFVHQDQVYWLIHGSDKSSINTPKKTLDKILLNFESKGIKHTLSKDVLQEIDGEIWWHVQTKDQMLYMIIGIFLLVVLIMIISLYFSGQQIEDYEGNMLIDMPYMQIKVKGRFFFNITIGALALTDQYLYITILRKPLVKIPFEALEQIKVQPKGFHQSLLFIEKEGKKVWVGPFAMSPQLQTYLNQ
jgi:hypothetical protein